MRKTAVPPQSRLVRRAVQPIALEPRFMFDGAAVDTAVHQLVDAVRDSSVLLADATVPALFEVAPGTAADAAARWAQDQVRSFLTQATPEQLFQLFNGGEGEASAEWLANAQSLIQRVQDGTHSVQIRWLTSETMGLHQAAYAKAGPDGRETIFLNADWWSDPASASQLVPVLLEELGHSFDAWLNPGQDTAGDEGERLAAAVLGLPLDDASVARLSGEDDHATLVLDGVAYEVEHASFKFTTAFRLAPEYRYYAEKEQESDRFKGEALGVASITDNTSQGTFSGNDVVVDLTIGGTTYHGWISRPIKDQGIVRGFYFWYDPSFNTFTAASNDGNQDGDSDATDNQGFVLVVDKAWFDAILARAPVYNNGTVATNVYEVGSSSDRVDSALNEVVSASNVAPSAVADTRTITQGTTSATGNVLTNDSDSNGNTLSVTQFAVGGRLYVAGTTATLSGVGTLVINPDGSYTFTPVAGYTGTAPVATYTVSDGLTSANATLTVTVTPVNAPPDAVNDTGAVTEDVALTGNLLSNDTDPNGNTLTVTGFSFTPTGGSLVSGTVGANTIIPGVGTLIIYSNGSYTFTPAANYDGAVPVITYAISDGNGGTDTATLTLTITGVPDGPTLSNDTAATGAALAIEQGGVNNGTAGQSATGNVLTNDLAGSGSLTVTQAGQAAATLAVTAGTTSANGLQVVGRYGTLTLGANGSYAYVVNDSDPTVQALRLTGQTLTDSFTYRAVDGSGLSATATLTVTIDGRNDTPVAANDYNLAQETTTVAGSGFASTGFSATGNVLTNDTDVDGSANGETKTITGLTIDGSASITSYTSPSESTKLVFKADGGFSSVNGGEELYVKVGSTYYLMFDSSNTAVSVVSKTLVPGTTADYEITLTGTPVKYSTGTAGSYTSISGLSFFSQKDVGFQNSTSLTQAGGGSMKTAISDSGVQSGSVVSIGASYTGTIAVGMEVSGTGITAGTTVSTVTYSSGVISSVTLSKSYASGVLSGTLSFTKTGTVGTSLTGQHGSLTLSSNGSYTYTPTTDNGALGAGQTATESFSYTMRDTSGATSTATLFITVLGASSGAPLAANDTASISESSSSVSATALTGLQANDTKDAGATVIRVSGSGGSDTAVDANGDYEVAGLYGTIKVKADGSYVYTLDPNNAAVNALHGGESLTETFQYVLDDASGGTYLGVDSANLVITINGVNDLPVGGKLPNGTNDPAYDTTDNRYEITTPEDTPINGQVKAFDADDASLTYTAATGPSNGIVTVNANGTYTYTPNGNYVGTDQFTVTVSDGRGGTTTITVQVTVTPVNDAPFLDLDGSASGTGYSTAYTFGGTGTPIADTDRTITDVDDTNIESATITLTNAQAGDSLVVGTLPGSISATVTNTAGQVTVTLTGSATLADYQAALRAITFGTTGNDRTTRNVTVVVNDGDTNSNTATTSISMRLTALTVEGTTVNEASPYAVFRVNGTSGQTVTLALDQTGTTSGHAVLGMDTTDAGTSLPLQYLNASGQWVDYTAGSTVTMSGTTLLVRTAIRQDQPFEGLETYRLVATDDAGVSASGQGGIIDDGTGSVFLGGNTTFTPSVSTDTGYPTLDDDRPIRVASYGPVNEASQYAIFTVTAIEGYKLDLQLQAATSGTAATRGGFTFEYSTDGSNWTTYTWNGSTGDQPTVPASGKVYVRVNITSEQDSPAAYEGAETFALKASYTSNTARNAAADTAIVDDGSGTRYDSTITSGEPAQLTTTLDDDRTIGVTSHGPVNEASPYAMFTVTAVEGYKLDLQLQAATSGTAATRTGFTFEYSTNGTTWTTYTWNGAVGDQPTVPAGGKVYVRVDITSEQDSPAFLEGAETFALKASYSSNTAKNAAANTTIIDDGTGSRYPGTITSATPDALTTGLDDDNLVDTRAISVASHGPVNEASTYAMFTVTADAGNALDLQLQSATSGTAATRSGFTFEYSTDGSNWITYTWNGTSGDHPTVPVSGKVYVRVDIRSEADSTYEGAETFALKASYTTNTATNAAANTSIIDDGTGTRYPGTITSGSPSTSTTSLDDDRAIAVTAYGPINEASQYGMFTVTALEGFKLDLSLQGTAATGDAEAAFAGFTTIQYSTDGTNWTTYTWNGTSGDQPTVPNSGKVYVRVTITSEADNTYEGAEGFALKAAYTTHTARYATGETTIVDDGTGTKYGPNVHPTNGPNTSTASLDDDRPITVTGGSYNENSPRAVFTVNTHSGRVLTLDVQDAASTGKTATGGNEGKPNDSLDTAAMYVSLDGGATWQLYTGPVTAGSQPLLVAVDIANERDAAYEGEQQLKLVASAGPISGAGYASIFDDGTGTITREIGPSTTNDTGANDPSVTKDDDRPRTPPPAAPPPPPAPVPAPPAPQPPAEAPPPPPAPAVPSFSSALTPLAPRAERAAEPPAPLGEALTSNSGFPIVVNESAPPGLNVNRGVTDQFVQTTGTASRISLPFDAFMHSNKDAVIKLEARQADNSTLPAWVSFDPVSGVLEVTPPPGFKGKLDVKVTARDDDGREAVAMFQLFVGEQDALRPQSREGLSEKLKLAGKRGLMLVRDTEAAAATAAKAPVRDVATKRVRVG